MRLKNEQGAALITALLVMSSFTLLSAAIVFTVQADVQMSANYKYGQQAYYVANAGIQRSLDWFNTSYASVPTSNYNATKVPLEYGGQPVSFSGKPGVTSNYPTTSTATSYESILNNQGLTASDGTSTGTIQANATLLRSRSVNLLNLTTFAITAGALERWRLDSIGFWGSSANPVGRSEVSAVIEQQGAPFWGRALWANVSIAMSGPSFVDSYDPNLGLYGGSNVGNAGDIGSNGSIAMSGSTVVFGNAMYMSTFKSWDAAPYTTSVREGTSVLPQPKAFPPIPAFSIGTTDVTGNGQTITEGLYDKITVSGGKNLNLACGTYNINELVVSGGSTITLDPACANYTFYIKRTFSISGGSILNPSQDPSKCQIFYSGTSKATLSGGSGFYGTVYAPNAQLDLSGASSFYGSFMANSITMSGGGNVHYDDGLRRNFLTPTPYQLITWTQKNY